MHVNGKYRYHYSYDVCIYIVCVCVCIHAYCCYLCAEGKQSDSSDFNMELILLQMSQRLIWGQSEASDR